MIVQDRDGGRIPLENSRSEWITRLYKISAGLIAGYFILCCLMIFFPQIPLRIAGNPSLDNVLDIPARIMMIVRYLFILPYAFFAVQGISADERIDPKSRLITAGVYYGTYNTAVSNFLRIFRYKIMAMTSTAKTFAAANYVDSCAGLFGVVLGAGVILLFCGLAVDIYEFSRSNGTGEQIKYDLPNDN